MAYLPAFTSTQFQNDPRLMRRLMVPPSPVEAAPDTSAEEPSVESPAATVQPVESPIPSELPADYGKDESLPLNARKPAFQSPTFDQAPVHQPTRSEQLQAQITAKDQPPSTKSRLLSAIFSTAPALIAAATGGEGGLALGAGLAEGANQRGQEDRTLQEKQRASLVQQMEKAQEIEKDEELKKLGIEQQRNTLAQQLGMHNDTLGVEQGKLAEDIRKNKATETQKASNEDAVLRKAMLVRAPDGSLQPIPETQMTPAERADLDKKRAATELVGYTEELKQAQTDLARAKNDPKSPAFQQAQQRVAVAQQNAGIAAQRLGLSREQFEANIYGTVNGQAIPGGPTDNGAPIGLSTARVQNSGEGAKATKSANDASTAYQALQNLAKQNTYSADQAMVTQYFDIIKPGSGARMNQTEINRLVEAGTLPERAKVWTQMLSGRQPFTPAIRQEIINAAKAVVDAKAGAPGVKTDLKTAAGIASPSAGKVIQYDKTGKRIQ